MESKRGVTLGNPIGQMLGNLALSLVDYAMVHIEHAKGYHRHCDDITFFAETKEEAVRLLGRLDYWCNQYGLCLKASGHVAELHDEEKGVKGRNLDFEDDVEVNGKGGRCWVLYEMKDSPGTEYKFCTSSKLIRQKLMKVREKNLLPVNDTFLFRVDKSGRYTYDLD